MDIAIISYYAFGAQAAASPLPAWAVYGIANSYAKAIASMSFYVSL